MWTTLLLLFLTMPSTVLNYKEANIVTSGSLVANSGQFSSLNVGAVPVVLSTDSRLTNSRTPTSHKTSHATGGSDSISPSDIGAAAVSHAHVISDIIGFSDAVAAASPEEVVEYLTTSVFPASGNSTFLYVATDASRAYRWTGSQYVEVGPSASFVATHTHDASAIVSGTLAAARLPSSTTSTLGGVIVGSGLGVTSGTVSVTYGTSSGTACQGNDSRLSDVRMPTSHASSHASGGSDALSLAASQITSGTIATARLGTGTADATTFLRGDGTFATPSASVTYATTAQAQDLTATTAAMNPANVRTAITNWVRPHMWGTFTASGGSVSNSQITNVSLTTSSTIANSSAVTYSGSNASYVSQRSMQTADWTKPITVFMRVYRQLCPSTGVFRCFYGASAAGGYAYETLNGRGIGFEIRQSRFWIIAHNGASLTQYDTGIDGTTSDYSGNNMEVLLRSDGSGNVSITVITGGGSPSTASTTGGPTTLNGSQVTVAYAGLTNGTAATQAIFWFLPHLISTP